jgi:hypothetical protein
MWSFRVDCYLALACQYAAQHLDEPTDRVKGEWNMKLPAILLAVLMANPGLAAEQTAQAKFVLEDGTPVKLVLAETISSADERVGNLVSFEVVEDVRVGDVVVIPRGSTAWATVTAAEPKKRMGRGGKLDINIDKVRLADGEKVLLRAIKDGKGGGHEGAMVGGMVATGVVWPAAPFFLFMHGKDLSIPKGTQITAYSQGDVVLDPAKFTPEALAPKPVPATAPATTPASAVPAATPQMVVLTPQQESLGDLARKFRIQKAAQSKPPQQ